MGTYATGACCGTQRASVSREEPTREVLLVAEAGVRRELAGRLRRLGLLGLLALKFALSLQEEPICKASGVYTC